MLASVSIGGVSAGMSEQRHGLSGRAGTALQVCGLILATAELVLLALHVIDGDVLEAAVAGLQAACGLGMVTVVVIQRRRDGHGGG